MMYLLFLFVLTSEAKTYKDVKPIFEKRCALCHNANWKDKNWLDEATAKKYAKQIKSRVWDVRNMPPSGDITEDERKDIKSWAQEQ